mmetsp:Transcript_5818/g.13736  ORF Transcript_5818/g.13736 Transcript_5818/m.13736 type:complete len:592 (-) Transcript_5818:195-1970(-)
MYKKQFTVQAQHLLSKKDVKGLKVQLGEQYPGLEDKVLDELLPEGQVKVLKLDSRCLLYSAGESPPVFFDAEGRGELYPTLTTLWQHPHMMLELTIHAPVSKFVLNGADLMLPGVLVPANGVAGFGTVTKGQKRCIKIDGNPYPIAVGKMLVNQAGMEKLKGKGLEVLHVFKDALWAFAGKLVPNAGFSEKEEEITPCEDASWSLGAAAAAGAAAEAAKDGAQSPAAAAAPASPTAAPAAAPMGSTAAVPLSQGEGTSSARAASDWSQDELLDFCFMQAFKVSLLDDKLLPIEASELYEKHMKPARPEGTSLDVKKSTHKQIGKYLNAMRKAKVIEVVEKKSVVSVARVDRGHKVFAQFEEKFGADVAAGAAVSAAASSTAGAGAAAGLPPPQISAAWKPTHYLESIWKDMGKSKSDVCSWAEAKQVLVSYIEKQELGSGDSGTVKLNEELLSALFKAAGAQKKDQQWPEEADFAELEEKMQDRMQEHTLIEVAGAGSTMRKGPALKIEVSLSRKGAHNITRVCNLEAYGLDVQALGDELKRKLNCTVHIEDMPGKNSKDKLLQLQGHVDQELAEFLKERYGITKSFMSVK